MLILMLRNGNAGQCYLLAQMKWMTYFEMTDRRETVEAVEANQKMAKSGS